MSEEQKEATPEAPKPVAPKARILPINEIELIGLNALCNDAIQAAQRRDLGFQKLALAHGVEPAKFRYQVSEDGKTVTLIDAE